ncbi:AMIN domain-containing protein [Epibacterium sp. SM1969]|uniref:N-acetylmuramoyl-L-alanine amidase n=1 Tax=Tritonibacter aquimaris TaxID=2663379 RepID=A0A844B0L1_9RHOB|nr:N-acetylmuramoyl-L-alanine amidase [Tritonibacter aquimaris]MQY42936.1 AMIN domain-containing protein [Tritonibacter aquimaris]
MRRLLSWVLSAVLLAGVAGAQEFSGLARIDAPASGIELSRGGADLTLQLSQGVPYRVFTLDAPRRLVLDFQEVDWTGLQPEQLLADRHVVSAQFGTYVPGWSRLVLELAQPMQVKTADLSVDTVTAAAQLKIALTPVDEATFAARAGAPVDPRWDLPAAEPLPVPNTRPSDAPLMVVLDPGHGGIDPGAQVKNDRFEIDEKELALQFALELGEILLRSGQFDVRLTRNDDYFVSLERRITLAHQAKADVFISIHADSLSAGYAHGTTIYTLSDEASDVASAKLAERQQRSQLLAGTDLSDTDDQVADVLLDLARVETHPRSLHLAQSVADGMAEKGGPMNRRPLRSAGFSVLKSADIPSVLIEIGFLSSPRDLENLMDPDWRRRSAFGILNGLLAWQEQDAAQKTLVRQ